MFAIEIESEIFIGGVAIIFDAKEAKDVWKGVQSIMIWSLEIILILYKYTYIWRISK